MREPEITSRICREDLKDLLETEAPMKEQRITARMPAVTLSGLLHLPDEDLDPAAVPPPRVRPKGTSKHVARIAKPAAMAPLSAEEVATALHAIDRMAMAVVIDEPQVRFRTPAAPLWPLNAWPAPLARFGKQLATLPRPAVVALSATATLVVARLLSLL